jgi:hypothetical protein
MNKQLIDWNAAIKAITPSLYRQSLIVIKEVCDEAQGDLRSPQKAINTISAIVNGLPGLDTKEEEET